MEAHLDRQDRREFRDKRATLEDQRYQDQQKRLDSNEAENARRYMLERERQQGLDDLTEKKTNAAIASYQQTTKANQSADELRQLQIEAAKRDAKKQAGVDALLAFQADGQITDERLAVIKDAGLDPRVFGDREFTAHLKTANAVFTGKLPPNSPEAIKAVNGLLRNQIERGIGEKAPTGGVIASKRVKAVYPGDGKKVPAGHVVIELEVADDKGNTWTAPLTMNRSSDPNDTVKPIPVEAIAQHITGLQMIASDKVIGSALRSLGHQVDSGTWRSDGNGGLFNDKTAETKGGGSNTKQQYDYITKQINDLTRQLSGNSYMEDGERQQIQQQIAQLRGQAEQLVGLSQGGAGSQPQGGERSWEDRVNAIAEANKVSPAEAEAEMLKDERFAQFAPPKPVFGEQSQSVGLADIDPQQTLQNLQGKDVSQMSLEERLDHEAFTDRVQQATAEQKQTKREAKKRLSQLERMVSAIGKRSANNPDNWSATDTAEADPGEVQMLRAELELLYEDPRSSKKDREAIVKLIKQLP